jgi:phosphoribosylformimino-5-aminoimidazole carboxamide ribotide isomerase
VRIIPVIDLLEGVVVHAKQGQRKHYQPIVSSLTASTKPLDIVKAFREIYPFETLYIADLNAIQKLDSTPSHLAIIAEIQHAFPELNIWLDAGIRNNLDTQPWQSLNTTLVLGTESLESLIDYLTLKDAFPNKIVLSLDFMPSGYKGLETFIQSSQHWSKDVIVMTLDHVGMQQGIASSTLAQIMQLSHQHRLYAAGGVRNLADVAQLACIGVHGALVATALHQQQLDAAMLQQFSQM